MIKPLGNRVLVKRLSLPEQTKSGLFILGREWPAAGYVCAIGNGKRAHKNGVRQPIDICVGEFISYDKWAAETRAVPGEKDFFILDVEDCFFAGRG